MQERPLRRVETAKRADLTSSIHGIMKGCRSGVAGLYGQKVLSIAALRHGIRRFLMPCQKTLMT